MPDVGSGHGRADARDSSDSSPDYLKIWAFRLVTPAEVMASLTLVRATVVTAVRGFLCDMTNPKTLARRSGKSELGGEISAVEDPVGVIRCEQVEVAVPGFWCQRCWPGEGDVLLVDGEAPAEARDRLDVAGEHRVG